MTARRDEDPASVLFDLVTGYGLSQAVYVAAKLGVADRLADGPLDGPALARAVGVPAPPLSRVLRLLAAHGVLEEVAPDRFALAPAGELLREGVPGSLRPFAVMTMELEYPAWGQLLHSVATGEAGFPRAFGAPEWEYLARTPAAAAVFDAAMVGITRWQAAAVVAAYEFAGHRLVVDVGGGRGQLLAAILAAHPALRGVLFDTPAVVDGAGPLLEAAGVADRCASVGGDFLAAVPEGGDAYVLKSIVHDWDDERAATILRNCRRAMVPRGKVLLVERPLPPGLASEAHRRGLWADVHMMVLFDGRERTLEQYAGLLAAADLRLGAVVPATDDGFVVMEGLPA